MAKTPAVHDYITQSFPPAAQSALRLLPSHILSCAPLYGLLEGFKTDLEFHANTASQKSNVFPIKIEHDLDAYAARVAGTVAESFLELVFHHTSSPVSDALRKHLVASGGRMGVALQYVNIARDIKRDAVIGRVYIPTAWLKEEQLAPEDVLEAPDSPDMERLRERLLDRAFAIYHEANAAVAQIPLDARAPMRGAVESYMEIGRVLRERGYTVVDGRATVPKIRRIRVAWKALSEN